MKFVAFFLGFLVMAFGDEYSVIVSKKLLITAVSAQEIRDVFLQKRHTIKDQKIIPINLVGQDDGRSAFESVVLGMDRNRLNAYWNKQHFAGVNPPVTQPSYESVKSFVQNVDGAIGYIPSKMVDNTVKVIYEF